MYGFHVSMYLSIRNYLSDPETFFNTLPKSPVTPENAPSSVPVTLPTVPLTVEPTVDTVLSIVSNAPSVEEPPTEVDEPEPHSEDDVVEFVTSLPLKPTSHAAEEQEVQPPRRTLSYISFRSTSYLFVRKMFLLQLVEEVELVPSLADSEDEDEPRRPLLLELLLVGPESDAPVSRRSSRSCRDVTWGSCEIRNCGRSAPELRIDVAPRMGESQDRRRPEAQCRADRSEQRGQHIVLEDVRRSSMLVVLSY
jgi:hypothetical protein